jgi:formimidoylglutamate deiminase
LVDQKREPIWSVWFAHALLSAGWARAVRVEISGGVITGVTTDADSVGASRFVGIALPGVPNLHSHAVQRSMAGLTEMRGSRTDNFWAWREVMYRFLARLEPEDVEAISAYAYMRMLEAGYTAVGEFHYLHHAPDGRPYADPGELAARIVAAAAGTGIGLTLLPCFYHYGGFNAAPPTPGQRRFVTDLDAFLRIREAAARHLCNLPDARLGIAPHSLRAVGPDELEALLALCPQGPVHIHAAEQATEVAAAESAVGAPPVAWLLAEAGVDARWCIIHATHIGASETATLAASGAVAGLCPLTEANLGDGIFPGAQFVAAGGRFGIGSDSNVIIDPAGELRQLETSQRLAQQARNVLTGEPHVSTGRFLLQQALSGGAQALVQNMGTLAAGKRADIVVLDAKHADMASRSDDGWVDTWIFAAPPGLVREVIAGGRHVVRQGRHFASEMITRGWRRAMHHLVAA